MMLEICVNWRTSVEDKSERIEIYNYRNKEDFETFRVETEDNVELRECFNDEDEDLEVASKRWLSLVNKNIKRCFKKIRIKKGKIDKELEELFQKKDRLKTMLAQTDENNPKADEIEDEIEKVVDDIANHCGKRNKDIATEYLEKMKDPLDGFNQIGTWNLKKKLSPKNSQEPPMAKKDSLGNLVTDKAELEKLYLETYVNRLKPNQITPGLETLEDMKNYLFQLRYVLCKDKKSSDWTIEDLENAFKSAKNNKARDAHGHTYEIYKFGGKDLKISLLKLCNLVKKKQVYPSIFQPANITSLYKSRGEKSDFENDRGVFCQVKIRSLLDRLVYNAQYQVIDENMGCSNIGARKGRNIRDHLFVINAILHEVSKDKSKNIDLGIYDVRKCFDKIGQRKLKRFVQSWGE